MSGSIRASSLYAGIAIARRLDQHDNDAVAAVRYMLQGPADLAALDFGSAHVVAARHTWSVFSAAASDEIAFRETIRNIASLERPVWIERAPLGRARVVDSVDADVQQCLRIAGLLGSEEAVLGWWDDIASEARLRQQLRRLQAGREAERRSLERETMLLVGTGLEPTWLGIEDNTVGFDIRTWRSCPASEAGARLAQNGDYWREHAVEVKSAMRGDPVRLTRREWEEATLRRDRWELQLWLPNQTAPRVISLSKLVPHIPNDNSSGQWTEVRVPVGALLGE
jgi:hypothetical protein